MNLSDFWGNRWNRAFRDLTHRFLFRPLVPRLGGAGSVLVGFLFSGLVHDLVISLPARGGYGGPTLFFLLQGVGLLTIRSPLGKKLSLGQGIPGRVFSYFVLLLPAPILFHKPFVMEVILPFLRVLGAIQ